MTYELTKELKDARFPLKVIHHTELGEHQVAFDLDAIGMTPKGDWYLAPTLSELIEACGDNLNVIYFPLPLEKQIGRPVRAISNVFVDSDEEECIGGEGSTPEEAVAMLWLALNRPNS